jgi:prephenate dehydratase
MTKLGFLGPAGTFSHEALRASPRSAGAEEVPFASERETIMAVAAGDIAAALVPIENALEGPVTATLDTLAHDAPGVRIIGEEILPISHCLAAREGVTLQDLVAVASHPQALGQCRRFLREVLPGRRIVAATSTAEGVRQAVAREEPWAGIGPRASAALHGATVLREGIEDEPGNATRFVWIARADALPEADTALSGDPATDAAHKTSLVFHGAGDDSPGWLVRCLSEFAFRGLNLTKIESRPSKRRLGHYIFLADLEGRDDEPNVAAAIEGLRAQCEEVRVLGSYPAA